MSRPAHDLRRVRARNRVHIRAKPCWVRARVDPWARLGLSLTSLQEAEAASAAANDAMERKEGKKRARD